MTDWQDRVIGFDRKPANQFLAHPDNPRRHPNKQRDSLRGSLETLGNYDVIIENQQTGYIIDGHARVEEALTLDENMMLPYILVDLSESEERLALASHDFITTLAVYDYDSVQSLLSTIESDDSRIQTLLSDLDDFADNQTANKKSHKKAIICPHCGESFEK